MAHRERVGQLVLKLPDHWNERSETYLAFPDEVGLARVGSVIFYLPFFAAGVFVLGVAFFLVIPKLFQFNFWWGGPVVLLLCLLNGPVFSAVGLTGMFYRTGVIFDRDAQTCLLWSRFLFWGRSTSYSLEGYDAADAIQTGSGMFGTPIFLPQLTGKNRRTIQIKTVRGRWPRAHKITDEIAQFLWSQRNTN